MLRPVENHSLPRTAAFFDLDKAVIAKSSALTFSKSFYQGGLINRRAVLRTAYTQFAFLSGGAEHGWMERMREHPSIYDEAASLIEEHHTAGRDVVSVTTSGAEVVEPIGPPTGWWPDGGGFTGEVEYYAYGPTKAEAVRK
ncbi:hypothetical protein GCM10010381_60980 [Streptomyces xantholiticus]|nr:hypothetical protein GCM10010381_60980 [Streptomyces xantholiticus]